MHGYSKRHGKNTDDLFFAIFPDEPAANRTGALIEALRSEHGFAGNPVQKHRLHMTIHAAGGYENLPSDVVDRAVQAAAKVKCPEFQIELAQVTNIGDE